MLLSRAYFTHLNKLHFCWAAINSVKMKKQIRAMINLLNMISKIKEMY
jgi:hypothetical protein